MDVCRPGPGVRVLDGTFGRGGHTSEFLRRGADVVALDRDAEAVAAAEAMLSQWGEHRLKVIQQDFRNMVEIAKREGPFDAVLLDLGISSPQVDTPVRGFSFMQDGPLDMRMDAQAPVTAASIINESSESEIADILYQYGEERKSRPVARAICREREKAPITTTLRLAQIVEAALGGRRGASAHPATRTFQALRIAVNDELGALRQALESLRGILREGGRLAVISFHSLEDRMVKQFIQKCCTPEIRGEGVPFGNPNPDYFLKKLGDWPASAEEVASNPRSRSARLRAAERIPHGS